MKQTHCKRGHELAGANLYIRKDGQGPCCYACRQIIVKEWNRKNKDHVRERRRAYAERNRQKIRDRAKLWRKNSGNSRRRYKNLKKEIILAYGGKCSCCGEFREEFLSIDHIYNDGRLHREKLGNGPPIWYELRRLGYPKDRFALLCFNCNIAKYVHKICPHQLERAAEALLCA